MPLSRVEQIWKSVGALPQGGQASYLAVGAELRDSGLPDPLGGPSMLGWEMAWERIDSSPPATPIRAAPASMPPPASTPMMAAWEGLDGKRIQLTEMGPSERGGDQHQQRSENRLMVADRIRVAQVAPATNSAGGDLGTVGTG